MPLVTGPMCGGLPFPLPSMVRAVFGHITPQCADRIAWAKLNWNDSNGWEGENGPFTASLISKVVSGSTVWQRDVNWTECGQATTYYPPTCPPYPYLGEVHSHCCSFGTAAYSDIVSWVEGDVPPPPTIPPGPPFDPNGCGCNGNSCDRGNGGGQGGGRCSGGTSCGTATAYPIRYATGEVLFKQTDLESQGYGVPWGHTRSFLNGESSSQTLGNGFGWIVSEWPYLIQSRSNYLANLGEITRVVVMGKPGEALWFDLSGGSYVARFGVKATLLHLTASQEFELTYPDGSRVYFNDLNGAFKRQVSPGGMTISVTGTLSAFHPTDVERSYTESGNTTTEQLHYVYSTSSGDALLETVTLRRKVNAGAFQNVSQASYTYYPGQAAHGMEEDLQTVTTQEWNGSNWVDTGTTYYRYYTPSSANSSSSSSSSGDATRYAKRHLLKYVLLPDAYRRLVADPGVSNPLTAPDSIVALYADNYFEYDDQRRVTKEMVFGASQTYLFSYQTSGNADGYNSWKTKTTETLPDGNRNIVFSNYAGQNMLGVLQSPTDGLAWSTLSADDWSGMTADDWSALDATENQWISFRKYDANAKPVLEAKPSAVIGYDETKADLLNFDSGTGKYQYLRDSDGLIDVMTYHVPSGYVGSESVQKGQTGSPIVVKSYDYLAVTAGGSSSSSSSSSSSGGAGTIWKTSKVTQYPSDSDPSQKIVTAYSYTFYTGTTGVQQKITTLPAIATVQNGSGISNTNRQYFDLYGNLTWRMDERGYLTRMAFDIPTGAITQQTADANVASYADAPAGWTTPADGGLNLVTDFDHDDRGRITQSLGPAHTIDLGGTTTAIRRTAWLVYIETSTGRENRIGQGYATGAGPSYTYSLVNPVSITKTDIAGKVQEQIQATRASTSGKLTASDTFAQSTYTRWKTTQYTDCCHIASERLYRLIPSSGAGVVGTNYDETDYGYDVMKRANRKVTPGGTIMRMVFEARGLVTANWTGTNDTGATASDPSGGGAVGNNMVIVTGNVYDGGTAGGDGNLTQQTQYAAASDTRVTSITYDFRDRMTDVDGEVDYYQKTYYDNLDRQTKTERYNTTSGGTLIGRRETKFDDLSRIYQSIRYAVNPSTGAIGNALTDNTWYDASGNMVKSLPSGSKLFTKSMYDSLGRKTRNYTGYDLDETTYAEALTVTGDTILQQTETTYDDGSNTIQSVTRMRYHNAPDTQTGGLGDPSTSPKARVIYVAQYPDGIGRMAANADYGTNGGTALTRSATIPMRSNTILVTSQSYDSAGDSSGMTDPQGMLTSMSYDAAGRETQRVMNSSGSSSSSSSSSSAGGLCPSSDDANVTVQTAYNADGNVSSITAINPVTGSQTTQYVYGTVLPDSDVASSLLKRQEIYPDSVDVNDRLFFNYNRQGQVKTTKDQNGTIHTYEFDKLGRVVNDRAIVLGTGVDGAIVRIASTYDVRGLRTHLTSWDNTTIGSGSVVNDVQFAYNDFSQLTTDYQAHGGAVNTSTSPKVQYGYANGSANTVRPTTLTYPNSRVLNYNYGTANGINDASSRIGSLIDNDGTTHLADYQYLGANVFVEQDDTQPDIKWTMIDLAGSNDPDTGDIYSGFDRFGRVKDNRWYSYGASADVDRIKYGYNRAGSRIWRENTVATALSANFDELYSNDGIQRLKDMQRGRLNGGHTNLTTNTFAQCWTLDPTGNWKGFREDANGDGTWDLNQARTSNTVNEITGITNSVGSAWVTPAYNKAGNMTTVPKPADPAGSYAATYDAWNRLVKLVDGANTVSEYVYDGAKRRVIQKSYTGGTLSETRHLYYTQPSQWQVIEERTGTSTSAERQFVWGLRYIDDIVLRDRDTTGGGTLNERLYGMQDANWNVAAVADTSGTVQERYAYAAYGKPMFLTGSFGSRASSSYAWETLYCAYRFESATRMYHVRHRVLHLVLGTWIQRDPRGLTDGPSLYEYAHSSPLTGTDPSGLEKIPLCYAVNEPCAGAVFSCVCLIINLLSMAAIVMPPGPITALASILDCACNMLSALQQFCAAPCDPPFIRLMILMGASGVGCMLDLLSVFGQETVLSLEEMQKLVFALWGYGEAASHSMSGGGLQGCFNFLKNAINGCPT